MLINPGWSDHLIRVIRYLPSFDVRPQVQVLLILLVQIGIHVIVVICLLIINAVVVVGETIGVGGGLLGEFLLLAH